MLEQKGIGMSKASKTRYRNRMRVEKKRNPNKIRIRYISPIPSEYLSSITNYSNIIIDAICSSLSVSKNWDSPTSEEMLQEFKDYLLKVYNDRLK